MPRLDEVYKSDGSHERPNVGTFCTAEEGKTRQEFKAESDINTLMKRGESAIVPNLRDGGFFADVSQIGDLHDCLEKVRLANDVFAALPPGVRAAFDNEPAKFTKAFDNPEGIAKLRELKVVAEDPAVVQEAAEAAFESRAQARARNRERDARVKAAEADPPAGSPPSSSKGA